MTKSFCYTVTQNPPEGNNVYETNIYANWALKKHLTKYKFFKKLKTNEHEIEH